MRRSVSFAVVCPSRATTLTFSRFLRKANKVSRASRSRIPSKARWEIFLLHYLKQRSLRRMALFIGTRKFSRLQECHSMKNKQLRWDFKCRGNLWPGVSDSFLCFIAFLRRFADNQLRVRGEMCALDSFRFRLLHVLSKFLLVVPAIIPTERVPISCRSHVTDIEASSTLFPLPQGNENPKCPCKRNGIMY